MSQPVGEGVNLKSTRHILRRNCVETFEDSVLDWQTRKPHLESCGQFESLLKNLAFRKTEKRTPIVMRMVSDHGFQIRELCDCYNFTGT